MVQQGSHLQNCMYSIEAEQCESDWTIQPCTEPWNHRLFASTRQGPPTYQHWSVCLHLFQRKDGVPNSKKLDITSDPDQWFRVMAEASVFQCIILCFCPVMDAFHCVCNGCWYMHVWQQHFAVRVQQQRCHQMSKQFHHLTGILPAPIDCSLLVSLDRWPTSIYVNELQWQVYMTFSSWFIHPFIHLFIHSSIHSFIHSFIHSDL